MDIETHNDGNSLETLPVMLEQNSLQKLLNISGSPTRRSDVRTIIICTHHISRSSQQDNGITDTHDYRSGDSGAEVFHADPDDVATIASVNQNAYWSCLRDQEKFTSGLALTYLTDAMKQLPNCKTISISDAYTPLGAVELEDRIGTRLCTGFNPYSQYSRHFVIGVLRTTLRAISGSGIEVTELNLCLGLADKRGQHSITDDAFYLPEEHRLLMHDGFTNIKTLRLVVNTQNEEEWDKNVSSFVRLFPNLSHFRLHLADRGSSVEFSYLIETLQTLSLAVFELVNCSTTQENLMPLLCH